MKPPAILSLLFSIILSALMTSCAGTQEQRAAQLTKYANLALNAAEISGRINPKQAALIRQHGSLVIDAVSGKGVSLEATSHAVVDYAVISGQLTPEQGALLKTAGEVPLFLEAPLPMNSSPAVPLLLPDVPTK